MMGGEHLALVRGGRALVDDVTLQIEPGTVTALLGPNGAGKTTLLRLLSGELKPDAGAVSIEDQPIQSLGFETMALKRAVMKQSSDIVFDFSVNEILGMGWIQDHRFDREDYRRARDWVVSSCDIEGMLDRTFNTLSGGEQQRVHFARTLLQIWRPEEVKETRYLLLDEPTASLDLSHELIVLGLAKDQAALGVGVLVVLHDLNLAARFANRVCLLSDGRVVAAGTPEEVFRDDLLTEVYQTPITIERHERLGRLVVHSL